MVFVRERGGGCDGEDGDFLESEGLGLGLGCAGNVDSRKSCLLGGLVKLLQDICYVMRVLFGVSFVAEMENRAMGKVMGGCKIHRWNSPEKVWRRAHHGEEDILKHGHPIYCHGFLWVCISRLLSFHMISMKRVDGEYHHVCGLFNTHVVPVCGDRLREDIGQGCQEGRLQRCLDNR